MVFGFGFNKTKVLSSAERFVQQGKLQNAIAEYEKIVKEDPKDLTVLNTIGDLYARVGNSERAASYFRRVGDAYAADGFTVKAIAMYKKLTKLNPAAGECVAKLAELYTQQGLYNDARSQYVQIADQHLRKGELEQAVQIFKKMLELDPENTAMQSKLADIYVRLGKKSEARDIFFRAAESLLARGALDQADENLDRVLKLDPADSRALLLRGRLALDAGKAADAVKYLEKVPDIDSHLEGLQGLLRAHLMGGDTEPAEPIARKLLSVHNDISGLRAYSEALVAAGASEKALQIYQEYADRLMASDPAKFGEVLHGLIGRVKENPAALEVLRELYQRSGETTHLGEITELLAHASVQTGDLVKARDLYQRLVELEPENPQHQQNVKQVIARLGEDAVARPLTQDEGAQALMAEELEFTAPALDQQYPFELSEAITAALTDAELFESYNQPAKAVPALEAVAARAPRDVRINQRLTSLYARSERFEAAARCCAVLQSVYLEAGFAEEAHQYGEMAAKYAERAGLPAVPAVPEHVPAPEAPKATTPPLEPSRVEEPPAALADFGVEPPAAEEEAAPTAAEPETAAGAHEIDLSEEWESAFVAEPAASVETVAVPPVVEPAEVASAEVEPPAAKAVEPAVVPGADLLEEIRFYLSQSMFEEARAAVGRCEALAPQLPGLEELKQELSAATAAAPAPQAPAVDVEPEPAAPASFEVPAEVVPAAPAEPPSAPPVAIPSPAAEFIVDRPAPSAMAPVQAPAVPSQTAPEVATPPAPPQIAPPPAPVVALQSTVHVPIAEPMAPPQVTPAPPSTDVLGDFASDLDRSLGEDFTISAPPPKTPQPPQPSVAAVPAPPPPASVVTPPAAAVAATASAAAAAPAPLSFDDHETSSALSDIFAEFKEDVEQGSEKAEDPETHYNLGVAFKEMGLLDEAIGELQKVCQAIDRGSPFPQVMQAYTWLAQCFVEKGVPEAGIRWYERALKLPGNDDTSTALHYELAGAYEAAGNRPAALSHFLEVYGTNIDYRDVAERIKALKS